MWRHLVQWNKNFGFGSALFTQFWRCKYGFVYYSNVQRTFKDGKIKSTVFPRPYAIERHNIMSPMLRNGNSGQGHVVVQIGHVAYQPMRLGETNILVPFSCLCLNSIKSYWQKGGKTAQCALSKGQLRSPELFFGNNCWLDRDTDTSLYHWVCFVKAHRLICNMTYMNQYVTLTWDDLCSNFEIDLSRSSSICFKPARRAKHIDVKIMVLRLILQDVFTKNYFHIKRYFDLWWPLEPWILT